MTARNRSQKPNHRFYEAFKLFGQDAPYQAIADEVDNVPGVVAHGLVVGAAQYALVARPGEEAPQLVDLVEAAVAAQQEQEASSSSGSS